ncbi:MAG TPA: MBL fold metallo-hydrolase [Candidatus Woesebacteria bacterium]|nr:MBL fold metallo-hydrolase [Candidatus Woesebacteria bacterium]
MEIKYIGHSSFCIKTKTAKIVTDPFDPQMVGLKYPKQEADIITISHHHGDHNFIEGVKEGGLVIDWPGEFEKNEVRITGFASYHDKKQGEERGENTIFKLESENVSILHCGDLGYVIDKEMVETIGNVDILLIPVGGFYTINAEEAVKVINEIEPSIVIPMHYNNPEMNQELAANMQPLETFLKEIGADDVQPQEKLVIKKEDINPEDMQVVVLSI